MTKAQSFIILFIIRNFKRASKEIKEGRIMETEFAKNEAGNSQFSLLFHEGRQQAV